MAEATKDKFQRDFEALPLEQKLKTLLRLEAATLTETFSFAVNEPMKVVEKFGEVVADLGRKVEEELKKAASSRQSASTDPKTAECDPAKAGNGPAKGKTGKKKQ